jgi:hypothetical protein
MTSRKSKNEGDVAPSTDKEKLKHIAQRLAGQDAKVDKLQQDFNDFDRMVKVHKEDDGAKEFSTSRRAGFVSLRSSAEAAHDEFEREKEALYREDGLPVYSERQHEELLKAATEKRDTAFGRFAEDIAKHTAEINSKLELASLPPRLDDKQMSRAASRQVFVREDIESSPLEDIPNLLRQAEITGDRAEIWCAIRYAKMRAERELQKMRDEAAAGTSIPDGEAEKKSKALGDIRRKAGELEDSLHLPGAAKRKQDLKELKQEAAAVESYIRDKSITHAERLERSSSPFRP